MKRKVFKFTSIFAILVLMLSSLYGCAKKQEPKTVTKVRLNEVVRSVFYAPMYVAINEGFFKEQGIDIDLSTGQGADATLRITQVIKLASCT